MPAFTRFLRYFMVVGQMGSIRKAAGELNVSASAIDRQILNVEAELGIPLFERMPSGLRLTAAGEMIMAAGGRWQKELGGLRSQIEDLRGLKRGHIEIGIINALSKGYIPKAVTSIRSRFPGISVGLNVMANEHIREAILSGKVDFGIMFEPQGHRDLTVRAFVDVILGFVTPPDHVLAQSGPVRFSTCAGIPVVAPAEPLAVAQQVKVLEKVTTVELNAVASSNDIQTITSLSMEDVGVGILTSIDVLTEVRRGLLAFTPISDPLLRPMTLALCTASSRTPSFASAMALGEIENGFSQLGVETPASPSVDSAATP